MRKNGNRQSTTGSVDECPTFASTEWGTIPLVVMNSKLEHYYLSKPEPYQGCLLALRQLIENAHPGIVHERKFQIPFFSYKGKKLGYLWLNRKKLMLGFCLDKSLRTWPEDMKPKDQYESFQIDPDADLPVELILQKLHECLERIDRG